MPKRKIIYICVFVISIALLIYLGYFLGLKGVGLWVEKAIISSPQEVGAGEIGEVMVEDEGSGQELPLVSPTVPPAIFSTVGTVTEVKSDRVILLGDGTNFADGMSRTLIVFFVNETLTLNQNQALRWVGKAGLDYLKVGMEVLVEGIGNIRGKVEFNAKTINIL